MASPHDQSPSVIRLEWGLTGAQQVPADVAVVVDVLSFTTSTTIACARGATVWPCAWEDDRATALAAERDARLAVGRSQAMPGDISLSPTSIAAAEPLRRLVLPSPNGSTIAAALADHGTTVVAGCLRNRTAVGAWVRERVGEGMSVVVVPAGERWPDGSLRPAVEDLFGAGAILEVVGLESRSSPEALAAVAAFRAARFPWDLRTCSSGRELIGTGYGDDVELAAQVDVDDVVPVLVEGAFEAAR